MSHLTSNVSVVSNVYPLRYPDFYRQIRGRAALKKLAESVIFGENDERRLKERFLERGLVAPAQIEAYWNDGRSVDCPPGERPWGLGKNGIECRCERANCSSRTLCFPLDAPHR